MRPVVGCRLRSRFVIYLRSWSALIESTGASIGAVPRQGQVLARSPDSGKHPVKAIQVVAANRIAFVVKPNRQLIADLSIRFSSLFQVKESEFWCEDVGTFVGSA
jgi:hypothetical protein